MNGKIKKLLFSLLGFSLILQTGCWDQKLYEEIGFVLQMGLEVEPDGNLTCSVTSPVIESDVLEKMDFFQVSGETLVKAFHEIISNTAGEKLLIGKIQHIYFLKSLAEKGVIRLLDVFQRNPDNPLQANLVIVDGSPRRMMELSLDYQDKPRTAIYVTWLLKDARERSKAFETRVYNFSILSYSGTIDPVAPIIRYDSESIQIVGTALFSGDRMTGEINMDDTLLLNVLMRRGKNGAYIYREKKTDAGDDPAKEAVVSQAYSAKNPDPCR